MKNIDFEKLQSFFQIGTMMFHYDDTFTILDIKEGMYEMLGFTDYELRESCFNKGEEMIYKEDFPKASEVLKRDLPQTGRYAIKYRTRKKDETLLWVIEIGVLNELADGTEVIQSTFINIDPYERISKEKDAVLANLPGAIAYYDIVDGNYSISSANKNFFDMLYVKEDDYIGKEVYFTDPEDYPRVRTHFNQQAEHREDVNIEFKVKNNIKQQKWYHMLGSFYEDISGGVRYLCIMLDITENKHTVKNLAQEKERYRIAMEATSDAIFEYDVLTDVLTYYPQDGSTKKNESRQHEHWIQRMEEGEFLHPEDAKKVQEMFCNKQRFEMEVRLLQNDDESKKVYQLYDLMVTTIMEKDVLVRAVGILKNAENKYRKRSMEEEIQKIFNMQLIRNYDRILKIDISYGGYIYFQAADSNFMQIDIQGDYDEKRHQIAKEYIHPDERERYLYCLSRKRMMEVLSAGEPEGVNYYRMRGTDGNWRWKCYRYSYLGIDLKTIVISVQDIHDIRMAQQEQEEMNFNILTNALSEARHANEVRQSFMGLVTREATGPVRELQLVANRLAEQSEENGIENSEYQKIQQLVNHMTFIVNSIADMERAEKGNISFERDKIDLVDVIMNIIDRQRKQAEENAVKVIEKIQLLPLRFYYGDIVRVRQIITGIIANAVQFSPRGEKVRISMKEREISDTQTEIWIGVEDMGVPINPDSLERDYSNETTSIFGKNAYSVENSGFSLMLCKRIVELMGGKTSVNRGNHGENQFQIVMPLDYTSYQTTREVVANEIMEEEHENKVDFSGFSLFVIEGDDSINQLLGPVLGIHGASVTMARSVNDALSRWTKDESIHYDAIIMNDMINGVSCLELAERLFQSRRYQWKPTPMIVMTNQFTADEIKVGYQNGINTMVQKPVNLLKLYQVLNAMDGGFF